MVMLVGIGQARGVVRRWCCAMPRRAPSRVMRSAKAGFAAGEVLGQDDRGVIGRLGDEAEDEIVHRDRLARRSGRASTAPARRRAAETVKRWSRLSLPLLERLERQVERHHLGERGRDSSAGRRCTRCRTCPVSASMTIEEWLAPRPASRSRNRPRRPRARPKPPEEITITAATAPHQRLHRNPPLAADRFNRQRD